MTITRLGRIRGSRRAMLTAGDITKREFTETHVLTSDNGTDDEGHVYAAMAAAGFDLGDAWVGEGGSTNPGVVVVNHIISDHDATLRRWEVEVQYSSELPDSGSSGNTGTNPIDWSPEIEWDTEFIEYHPLYDINGDEIANGAGDAFSEPPITSVLPVATLRYSRWMSSYTSALNFTYSGKINSDVFLGYNPGNAFMGGIRARAELIYGFQYWWVTFPIKFRLDGWKGRSRNSGPNAFFGGDKKSVMTELGRPISALTAAGLAIDGPAPVVEKDIYNSVPFTPIL